MRSSADQMATAVNIQTMNNTQQARSGVAVNIEEIDQALIFRKKFAWVTRPCFIRDPRQDRAIQLAYNNGRALIYRGKMLLASKILKLHFIRIKGQMLVSSALLKELTLKLIKVR